jgi:hypothetical protein
MGCLNENENEYEYEYGVYGFVPGGILDVDPDAHRLWN